ncbi:MAG: carboxymuconolactone decarboxylase family protein [Sedimentisphaerales bacterium]|nr:carboxymuconolactone decarboxylase family protein [Sedimentisphaerales bacterium]
MSQEIKEYFEKFNTDSAKMKEQAPNMMNGFGNLFSKIMAEGALKTFEKELIAVGIAVAMRCEPCIKLHVKKCLDAGATKEHVLEAAGVAVMMGGGPAFTHIPVVMDTIETVLNE